jgi:hypothetical protein
MSASVACALIFFRRIHKFIPLTRRSSRFTRTAQRSNADCSPAEVAEIARKVVATLTGIIHFTFGAVEPHHAEAHATAHSADERVLRKMGERLADALRYFVWLRIYPRLRITLAMRWESRRRFGLRKLVSTTTRLCFVAGAAGIVKYFGLWECPRPALGTCTSVR